VRFIGVSICASPSASVKQMLILLFLDAPSIVRQLAEENLEEFVEEYTQTAAAIRLDNLAARHENLESSLNVKLTQKYIAPYIAAIHESFLSGVGRDNWLTPAVSGPITDVKVMQATRSRCNFRPSHCNNAMWRP
jgi:hypothetical protein